MIPALARRGEVVLYDELSHASIVDGCRLSGAETVALPPRRRRPPRLGAAPVRRPGGADRHRRHVRAWTATSRRWREIVALARRYDARVLVDEGHALGALGPGGRGAVAEAGVEDEVDVITGTLGKALGSYGGFVCCDPVTARFLVHSARTLLHSTALPPVAVAAAMAALELLEAEPRRVERLQANAEALRDALAREGFEVAGACAHVVPLVVGDAERGARDGRPRAGAAACSAEAVRPPAVPQGAARVRLAAMASHSRAELRDAARVLGRAALSAGFRPGAGVPVAAAQDLPRAA